MTLELPDHVEYRFHDKEWWLYKLLDEDVLGANWKPTSYDIFILPAPRGFSHALERRLYTVPFHFYTARAQVIQEAYEYLDRMLILLSNRNPGVIFRSLFPAGWRVENVTRIAYAKWRSSRTPVERGATPQVPGHDQPVPLLDRGALD
jgi:hypothetical protein